MGADVSPCPPRLQLERLLAEQLGGPERATVEAHVESCSTCQDRLDRLIGAPPPVSSAPRTGIRPGDAAPEPGDAFLDRLKQRSPSHDVPPPSAVAGWLENGRLGQYEVLGPLGTGGMGSVYRARHVELGKLVALKVLPVERVCEVNIARFRQEARALGLLDHPNIVAAYDAGEHRGVRYLVMALVDGVDLGQLVERRGPLPVADACELIRQAATGLQHAYERGLVHRDVKPQNLMLAANGTVKVLDLGLARAFGDTTAETLTAVGAMLGTADYLAPEQWDSPHEADTRSDIYALGCTLYHLIAGRPPFEGYRTVLAKLEAHQTIPPPPITNHRPAAPAELTVVLDRMLAKSASDRFATPAEVVEALRPFTAGADLARLHGTEGVVASTPAAAVATPDPGVLETTPVRTRPPQLTRRPVLPIAIAALALLALTLVALAIWLLGPGPGCPSAPLAKPLSVSEFRVLHFRMKGENQIERLGDLRTSSSTIRLNESVQVAADFNTPAYYYLIAFNPKGSDAGPEQLCQPDDESGGGARTIRPQQRAEVRYPRDDGRFAVDAVGLQVFVLAVSTKPLPPYEEWRSKAGTLPWTGMESGGKERWHWDGRELDRLTRERGIVERTPKPEGPPRELQSLCDWFKARPEFEVVQVVAFPVSGVKD
jgi:serine/threonine protein kinase